MQTVTLDKTGKIYFPKEIRKELKRKYIVITLPSGEIRMYPIRKFKTAGEALAWAKKHAIDMKTPASKARKVALEQAYQDIVRDRE